MAIEKISTKFFNNVIVKNLIFHLFRIDSVVDLLIIFASFLYDPFLFNRDVTFNFSIENCFQWCEFFQCAFNNFAEHVEHALSTIVVTEISPISIFYQLLKLFYTKVNFIENFYS